VGRMAGRKTRGETRKNYTNINKKMIKKITGNKQGIIRELKVLNDKKLYTLPLKYNTQT
jgi:hypothetical protein